MSKRVALYFGTFNPLHIGHLAIANHLVEFTDLDELWFVVTPRSPFKQKATLLDDQQRLHMVDLALADYPKLKASNVEFNLPQPNYTVTTLVHLHEQYPDTEFALVMGEDNLKSLLKWKNVDYILEHHHIYVYPRISQGTVPAALQDHTKIHKVDAPIMEISSTFIRNGLANSKNMRPLLPSAVHDEIEVSGYYL